ncbi:hypothetical protein B484DRAFT_8730 [Ochromonadaceae sp. CCMP2298]|nr:hypothetical protein B484DRAFT_8730 [Ochromonadaceae sp. CCMP2298]
MRAIPSSLPLPSLMSLVLLVLLALSPALCFNLHLDSFNKQTRVTQVQTQMQTQMQTQVQTQEEWRLKLNVPKVQVLAALSLSLSLCPFPAQADIGDILNAAARNSEISYSSNARNMGRLGAGDASGGSLYTSTSPAAQKRRAVRYIV